MKKYQKLLLIAVILIALTGCTQVIDPKTGQVMTEKIISIGDKWNFGEQGWFSALIVWPIAQLLNFFAARVGALAAIFIVTILIKLLTLKLSIQATVQQQKMQEIGPAQQRIEEKYRGRDDEQAKMQKANELQQLFKKHNINPLGALGGAFLQIPIMIAMYQAVMRAEQIINGNVFGQPLSGTPLDGFKTGNAVYIGIFVLMALFQFLSMFLPQYLTKKKMKSYQKQSQPKSANTMMYTSLVMIVVLALRWGVGMSLYWMVTAFTQLIQTLYIQNKYSDHK
ncbi:membrane protein insertase YidC [Erysipelothrix urinaevulpis]|uniref:membrane protein insertase YidC n=1 Tax=Erysipelothrix urinaevulpis TaxID=2683717 RepID=UPI00135B3143|nr:membrane protein insertase YidC [Erysipelothrix urinaevulpis]